MAPLALLLLGVEPSAFLSAVFCLGSFPALGITLMPPHLPVSRRKLLLWSSLPAAVVLLIMVGLGASMTRGVNAPSALLVGIAPPFFVSAADAPERAPTVELAADLWRLGEPGPEGIQLPDGTRVQPERRALGGLVIAHNPFTVPPDASLDQAAIQVHRAIEACCELRLSMAQVRAHLADGNAGSVGSLAAAAAQRRHPSAAGVSFFYLALVLLTLAWARVVLGLQPSAARAARSGTLRGALTKWLGVGLAAAFAAGIAVTLGTPATQSAFFAPRFFLALSIRGWESHPALGIALGAVVASLLVRSLLRRYERLEMPSPRAAFSGDCY